MKKNQIKKTLKKTVSIVMAAAVLATAPSVSVKAETDLTVSDYENLVSTYSVDDSIPSYQNYVSKFPESYSQDEVIITSSDLSRYENDGVASDPEIYTN